MVIYQYMPVKYELAGLRAGVSEPQFIYYVIQAPFQQNYQVIAGNAGLSFSTGKKPLKLAFKNSITILGLLLFSELNAPIGHPAPLGYMRPRRLSAPVDSAFGAKTSVTLKH